MEYVILHGKREFAGAITNTGTGELDSLRGHNVIAEVTEIRELFFIDFRVRSEMQHASFEGEGESRGTLRA